MDQQVDQAAIDETDALVADLIGGPEVSDSLQSFWAATFPTVSETPYHDPQGGFFPYLSGDPSGGACAEDGESAADNAAYCEGDESITYDVRFLAGLQAQYGLAGPIFVMAHEWGHHISGLAGSPQISKQAELQADCYAGMYLGSLVDEGTLTYDDVTGMLDVASSIGDAGNMGRWTDADVHGDPNERRQAAGIGFSTADGAYCVAYSGWKDEPAAPLFSDKSIRLEPFAVPVVADDGSYTIELPEAVVQVWASDHPAGTIAASVLLEALTQTYPDAADWHVADPEAGWIEIFGWATGSGATTTFSGTDADGSAIGGMAALLIDPEGTGELYVAFGADRQDPDAAKSQAEAGLGALTWGYCDPDAEITDNCPSP